MPMKKLGITEQFEIWIKDIPATFSVTAVVIEELSDEVNLGTGFLQKVESVTGLKAVMEFHTEGTILRHGESAVELISKLKFDEDSPREKGLQRGRSKEKDSMLGKQRRPTEQDVGRRSGKPICTMEDVVLEPNAISFIKVLRIPASALIEAVEIGSNPTCRAIPAVYQGTSKIAILNLDDRKQTLKKGTQVAEIRLLKTVPREGDKIGKISNDKEVRELWEQLRLEENEMLKENPRLMDSVKRLVKEYSDIFSSPEEAIGRTDLIEFDIKLKQGHERPVKAKLRPLNPKQKESLREQLELWKKEDVIEECESPWASALVPVLKKDKTTRWCVDYRNLNEKTVADAYPLPSISENLDQLEGSRVFSTLDAAAAFNTIPVEERSKPLLAFTTPWGLYTFSRMPFGPTNSGATYCRFVDLLISKLRSSYVMCYIDDVIIHTPDIPTIGCITAGHYVTISFQ